MKTAVGLVLFLFGLCVLIVSGLAISSVQHNLLNAFLIAGCSIMGLSSALVGIATMDDSDCDTL
jgi:hypothetical protein